MEMFKVNHTHQNKRKLIHQNVTDSYFMKPCAILNSCFTICQYELALLYSFVAI